MVSMSEQTEVTVSEVSYSKGSQVNIGSDEVVFNLKDWNLKQNYTIRGDDGRAFTFDFALEPTNNSGEIIPIKLLTGSKTERMDQIVILYLRSKELQLQNRYAVTPINVTPYENFLSGIFSVPVVKSIALEEGNSLMRITSEGVTGVEPEGLSVRKASRNDLPAQESLSSSDEKKDSISRRRRDHTRIIHDILTLAKGSGEIGITKIIYKCNLNYRSALRAVNELLEGKLLEIGDSSGAKQKYQITNEGLNLLDELKKFNFMKG